MYILSIRIWFKICVTVIVLQMKEALLLSSMVMAHGILGGTLIFLFFYFQSSLSLFFSWFSLFTYSYFETTTVKSGREIFKCNNKTRCGLACLLGVYSDVRTIGVAKQPLEVLLGFSETYNPYFLIPSFSNYKSYLNGFVLVSWIVLQSYQSNVYFFFPIRFLFF